MRRQCAQPVDTNLQPAYQRQWWRRSAAAEPSVEQGAPQRAQRVGVDAAPLAEVAIDAAVPRLELVERVRHAFAGGAEDACGGLGSDPAIGHAAHERLAVSWVDMLV